MVAPYLFWFTMVIIIDTSFIIQLLISSSLSVERTPKIILGQGAMPVTCNQPTQTEIKWPGAAEWQWTLNPDQSCLKGLVNHLCLFCFVCFGRPCWAVIRNYSWCFFRVLCSNRLQTRNSALIVLFGLVREKNIYNLN